MHATQVALEDLRKMRLELHLLMGSQKGSKASSRGGKSEEACEIVSLVLQRHRDDLGEAEEISVEELLPEEEARKVCIVGANHLSVHVLGRNCHINRANGVLQRGRSVSYLASQKWSPLCGETHDR